MTAARAVPTYPLLRRTGTWLGWTLLLLIAVEGLFGRGHTRTVVGVGVPDGVGIGILADGAVLGLLYALLAFGLILAYRANRVVNFAQVGLGVVPAVAALVLVGDGRLSYGTGVGLVLVGSAATGALAELVMRRFRGSSRLVAAVATLGVAQLLAYLALLLPGWITGRPGMPQKPTPFAGASLDLGGVLLSGDYLVIAVVTAGICVGLTVFLRGTRTGLAIRASAQNPERAALLGLPVARLSSLVWAVAGVLSGLAAFLQAPVAGLPTGGTTSPVVLLYGLVPAVVARLENFPVALAAGVAVGVVEQSSFAGTSRPDLGTALLLPLVLGALLLQRRRRARTAPADGDVEPIAQARLLPPAVARTPQVVVGRAVLRVTVAAAALGAPLALGAPNAGFCSLVLIFAMVAVSLVVLSGWAGQVSLGQFGFTAVGAAVAGGLAVHTGADFFVTLAAAALSGAIVAVLLGVPALRVQGLFLAVVTLAFAAFVQLVVLDPTLLGELLPAPQDVVGRPVLLGVLDVSSDTAFYYVCLAFLVLVCASARFLRASRSGRVFLALRDNERAAQSFGVPLVRTRLAAFALSGAIAALAGGLLAYQQQAVDQGTYGIDVSLELFLFVVVGGLSSLPGGVLGAVAFETLKFLGGSGASALATGAGVLLVLAFVPGGLAQGAAAVRDAALRRTTRDVVDDLAVAGPAPAPVPAPDPEALLTCRGLTVAYNGVTVLSGIDLDVRRGEVLALLGTNGAGKSTLLRALSGLVAPVAGHVELEGRDITRTDPRTTAQLGIAHVPGGRGTFPALTVQEHFAVSAKDAATAARQAYQRFPQLALRRDTLAGNLSGGEQQMLALSLALIGAPTLLLIDELSLGLAPQIVAQLLEVVRALPALGTTVVVVEQSVQVALAVADRACFLERGQLRFTGPTGDLIGREDLVRSVFFGPAAVPCVVRRPVAPHSVPALEAHQLSVRFGGLDALSGVSLVVRPGEIVGLIGANGAGKTTLFDVLSGYLAPQAGQVLLDGHDVTGNTPDRRARRGLGRSFQDARLFPSLSVRENLALACERHVPVHDHLAAALGLPAVRSAERDVRRRVEGMLELMVLGVYADTRVGGLSTGTRRVVDLAMSLAHAPSVLLLDEPSSGIARAETDALGALLERVRSETGCAMLLTEHDLPLVAGLADRLVALDLGLVVSQGSPAEVLNDPRVTAAYLGTSDEVR